MRLSDQAQPSRSGTPAASERRHQPVPWSRPLRPLDGALIAKRRINPLIDGTKLRIVLIGTQSCQNDIPFLPGEHGQSG